MRRATHWVKVNRSFVYPAPNMKLPPLDALPLGARVERRASRAKTSRDCTAAASSFPPISRPWTRPRAISSRSRSGCSTRLISGAANRALASIAPASSRSRSTQRASHPRATPTFRKRRLGSPCPSPMISPGLERGDLVFWRGHVGDHARPRYSPARQRASHAGRERAARRRAAQNFRRHGRRNQLDQAAQPGLLSRSPNRRRI